VGVTPYVPASALPEDECEAWIETFAPRARSFARKKDDGDFVKPAHLGHAIFWVKDRGKS
jgi:hypothetical protein